ncbi:MAG: sulfite exporter TauE/SafE family protein [Acidimicrobiales bacterium]|nr:sulfite exporter TauE/SafE family protein [Acidimicrobiales bacterium]
MRALLTSPFGFLIGLSLGALGGGGSILAVPVLVYIAGESPQAATTTSLIVVGLAALVGMGEHLRAGRVEVRPGLLFGLAGVGGSFLGSALNRGLDPDVLLLAFSGLIVIAAWRMLTGCPTCTRVGEEAAERAAGLGGGSGAGGGSVGVRLRLDAATVAKVVAAGTAVGFFTGLFGVGGGFIIVPALTLLLAFPMPKAIGTSLLIIAINCAWALLARVGHTEVDWAVTIPFAVAALAGVLTGTRIADRLPAQTLLRWFAGLLVAVAAYTAVSSLLKLLG